MPHRLIDKPLEQLPPIDEHSVEIDAPAEAAWAALFPTLDGAFDSGRARRVSRWLKTNPAETEGDLHHPGGKLPGFVVARAIAPVMLALIGSHRFSNYALVIRIDLLPGQRSRVRLETRAEFPGKRGRLYRAAVIGTRGHVIVVMALLRAVRKRAEQAAGAR